MLSTPTMVNSYVREFLVLLNYKATVDRFGMFLLHDLNMTKDISLPGVLVKDDLYVLCKLGWMACMDYIYHILIHWALMMKRSLNTYWIIPTSMVIFQV